MLDAVGVPTPKRIVTWNDDFPSLPPAVLKKLKKLNINTKEKNTAIESEGDTIKIGESELTKPFVEKPVTSENHNIYIYYDQASGGGVRKLFRKKGNKSSEFDAEHAELRNDGSYMYEEFISVDNAEDVKVYTIGKGFSHAETRKSPVVDGVVRRNSDGKEIRYIKVLNEKEQEIARKVCQVFGQTICGFDLLCTGGKSYVIDVNGWSFVKGNNEYYDKFAEIISELFKSEVRKRGPKLVRSPTFTESPWKLKAFMSVMRHADRTPKQKIKCTLENAFILDLVKDCNEVSSNLIRKSFIRRSNSFKLCWML
jgi:hypothetical protein